MVNCLCSFIKVRPCCFFFFFLFSKKTNFPLLWQVHFLPTTPPVLKTALIRFRRMFSEVVIINLLSVRESKSWSVSSAWQPVIGGGGVLTQVSFLLWLFPVPLWVFLTCWQKRDEKGRWTDLTCFTSQYKAVLDPPCSSFCLWGLRV